jgi:putative membrane protein
MKKNFLTLVKGFVMGIAEVVPGVSGSTLALVMGIYSDFISFLFQISDFLKEILYLLIFKSNLKKVIAKFKKININFGVFLFFGMLFAIALFSNIIHSLFENNKQYVLAFFFGLVLASVFVPLGEIKKKGLKEWGLVLLSAVVFFALLSLRPYEFETVPHPLYFFLGGSIAICAMVLPGISGSFIFLMLGLYEFIVSHISNFTKFAFNSSETWNLISLALGIVLGFSVFVRILKKGLENHSAIIFSILAGIMIASLRVLWPFYGIMELIDFVFLSLLSLSGFVVVFFLRKLG